MSESTGYKVCPFCSEEIREAAVKCRFCGEWLDAAPNLVAQPPQRPEVRPAAPDAPASKQVETESSAGAPDDSASSAVEGLAAQTEPLDTSQVPRIAVPEKDGSKITPKLLNWTSAGLLAFSVIIVAVVLSATNLKGNAEELLGAAVPRILICGGMFAWFARKAGKGYAVLAFSIVCAWGALMFVYYFNVGPQTAKDQDKQFAENTLDFYTNEMKYMQRGGTNGFPEIKLTGDPVNDAISQWMRDMAASLAGMLGRMTDEVDALGKRDVFDNAVLVSMDSLQSEVRKRTTSLQILESYRGDFASTMEQCKSKITTIGLTEEQREEIVRGIDNLLRDTTPQYNAVLDMWEKRERADRDFLKFMISSYHNYTLEEGNILFEDDTSASRYKEFAKGVADTAKEFEALARKLMNDSAAETAQIRAIGGLSSERER